MGVRTDIAQDQLETRNGRRVMSKCLRGEYTVTGAAKKLGVARDIVAEWLEELRARALERELWDVLESVFGKDSQLPTIVRRTCTVPFEYRHDAESLWLTLSIQMGQLHADGHELNEFSDPELASTRCEIVPADAPRKDWPRLIGQELTKFMDGSSPPITRVTPLRARALQAMAAEVVWANADESSDPDRARELAEGVAQLGVSIDEIRTSLKKLRGMDGQR